MHWSPQECLDQFAQLARKLFASGNRDSPSWTQRLHDFVRAYIRDYQYDSTTIKDAFQQRLGVSDKMFNPLRSELKVAVTTTTARLATPCLLSNYNGHSRSLKNGKCDS
jgi:hypothetical protein